MTTGGDDRTDRGLVLPPQPPHPHRVANDPPLGDDGDLAEVLSGGASMAERVAAVLAGDAPDLSDMDEVLGLKETLTETVDICLKPWLATERDRAEAAAGEADRAARIRPDDDGLASAAAAARAYADEVAEAAGRFTRSFTFRSIGRKRVEAMMEAMPPSKEQAIEFRRQLTRQQLPQQALPYDPDRFPPALMAAAAVDPPMTDDQATAMWNSDQWSKGELARMFAAAWAVNEVVG